MEGPAHIIVQTCSICGEDMQVPEYGTLYHIHVPPRLNKQMWMCDSCAHEVHDTIAHELHLPRS